MNDEKLDNPVWYALNSHQRHLGICGRLAARYQADVFMGCAVREYTPAAFAALGTLVSEGEVIGVGTTAEALHGDLPGWRLLERVRFTQMVCRALDHQAALPAVELTTADVAEMLALVALTQPGPFLPRTIAMGHYFGIRTAGQLVAMAGERVHLDGYCEISAVCTHPDFRGRGYAAALTTLVGRQIMARGEVPFLHLLSDNGPAYALYRKLGFVTRAEGDFVILARRER